MSIISENLGEKSLEQSFGGDENAVKLDSGGGCIIL